MVIYGLGPLYCVDYRCNCVDSGVPFSESVLSLGQPPASSIAFSSRGCSSFSNNFPAVSNMHNGLYDDGEFLSPFALLMRVNLAIFHRVLKTPCFRQSLYISSIKPGQALCAAFSASAGMLSGPGAFLFLSDSTACESSLSVKSGISLGGTVILLSNIFG